MNKVFMVGLASLAAAIAFAAPIRGNLGAENEMFSEDTELIAADYVSEGMVCLFDGIENVGWGEHDDDSSVWVDLIGGQAVSFNRGVKASFDGNSLWRDSSLGNLIFPIRWPQEITTIEIVCDVEGPFGSLLNPRIMGTDHPYGTSHGRLEFDAYEGTTTSGGPLTPRIYYNIGQKARTQYAIFGREPQGTWCVTARVFSDSIEWIDSVCRKSTSFVVPVADYAAFNTLLNVGAWNGTSSAMTGRIFCIRFYNRILTDSEIAYNHIIDKIRFGL